jgi:hypothetical protein
MIGPSHNGLVAAIRKLIREHGGFVFNNWGGPMGSKGVSDLIGVYRERGVAIEVKAGKDRLTEDQRKFLLEWSAAGGIALEARDLKTVADALGLPLLL